MTGDERCKTRRASPHRSCSPRVGTDRPAWHRRVARTIESVYANRLADFYGMLALHYSRCEDLEKAEDYLFKAGEEAVRSAASSEALGYFREAYRIFRAMHGEGGDPRRKFHLEKNLAQNTPPSWANQHRTRCPGRAAFRSGSSCRQISFE